MKNLIAILIVALSTSACAHDHRGHGGGWVAPMIIGGAIGYTISRPPVVVQQAPVIVSPAPVIVQNPVPIYQEVLEYNVACQCYVKSYRQIGWK